MSFVLVPFSFPKIRARSLTLHTFQTQISLMGFKDKGEMFEKMSEKFTKYCLSFKKNRPSSLKFAKKTSIFSSSSFVLKIFTTKFFFRPSSARFFN